MQDKTSRPSQKSYTFSRFGKGSAVDEARANVEDALILYPDMPAIQLAEFLIENADEDLSARLHLAMDRNFYRAAIRSIRQKAATTNRAQFLLPGFEKLPVQIPGPKGGMIPLMDANTHRVRQYCRRLLQEHRKRRVNDPKLKQALALLKKMEVASHTESGITVRQVLLLEN